MKTKRSKSRPLGEGVWFMPKRYGLGATPVTWQGWLATIVFTALLILALRFLPTPLSRAAAASALTLIFVILSIRKTDGGWRWHWGDPER